MFRHFRSLLLSVLLALPGATAMAGQAWRVEAPDDVPAYLHQPMRITVFLPPDYGASRRYPVLYVNDGQNRETVGLAPTLQRLYAEKRVAAFIAVAIDMPPDRIGAYGLSDRLAGRSIIGDSRIGPIGKDAHAYSQWLAHELVPYVDAHYATDPTPRGRAILGWSLGGLNAFNLGWQYPDVFATVGAFSPSFWLSSDRTTPQAAQRTRLAQRMVAASEPRDGLRLWIDVGDREEENDRDGDGVIDVVDDACDLVLGTELAPGIRQTGLAGMGYHTNLGRESIPGAGDDVAFHIQSAGKHDQRTWAEMLPGFLEWAFPAAAE